MWCHVETLDSGEVACSDGGYGVWVIGSVDGLSPAIVIGCFLRCSILVLRRPVARGSPAGDLHCLAENPLDFPLAEQLDLF